MLPTLRKVTIRFRDGRPPKTFSAEVTPSLLAGLSDDAFLDAMGQMRKGGPAAGFANSALLARTFGVPPKGITMKHWQTLSEQQRREYRRMDSERRRKNTHVKPGDDIADDVNERRGRKTDDTGDDAKRHRQNTDDDSDDDGNADDDNTDDDDGDTDDDDGDTDDDDGDADDSQ